METKETTPPAAAATPRKRRWPRRVAIGVGATAVVLGGAVWYLGREATLQTVAERIAKASGGKLTLTGVSGSLYGDMHIAHAVFRTPEQVVTADNIDIDWSPLQLSSGGVDVTKLQAAAVRVETLRESAPGTMPVSLAPPFPISVDDARIAKLTFVNKDAATQIDAVRLRLEGNKQRWEVRNAAASTPWGQVAASGSIGSRRPFKLEGSASLTQSKEQAGARAAQLKLKVGGDLEMALIDASGQAGRAVGDAHFALSPYAAIPLRELRLNGRNVDPGFFSPGLPTADLTFAIAARIDQNRNIAGSVDIANDGPAGTIDQQRLPLRSMRGQLGGNLSAMRLTDVLVDLGKAGKFTGTGGVEPGSGKPGAASASFVLHTDRLDLRQIHGSIKATSIAGDIKVATAGDIQTFDVNLLDAGMRLVAHATLDKGIVTLRESRLSAGRSSVQLAGSANLAGDKSFKVSANASRFDPSAFGDYPAADINADINASGVTAPELKVAITFALRPSRLFDQPLSGKGKLDATAKHVSNVDATLALGQNTVNLRGAFGAPGERLLWRLDGRQLAAARSDLYGALTASGVLSGTMAAPRTSFEVDARGLGWVAAQRKDNTGILHASGEAWLADSAGARVVQLKASGNAQRFNPAAFGSPLAGSINGDFDASGHAGAAWGGALNLALQPSTLSGSPLSGHAKIAADSRRVSNADVDLRVGPNLLAARGSFGAAGDKLDWRIDASQLGALGPNFAGALRGSGTLSGTMATPSLSATLDGQNLRLLTHTIRTLRASASLGSGRGGADPLVSDVQLTDYANGETRIAQARLQTSGTRAAHSLNLTAKGDEFDLVTAVSGGWSGNAWNGTVATLQNRGRYGFALQAPVPLRLAPAPGAGFMGLARPDQIALNGAVIRLPSGSVNIASLVKIGPRWNSRGNAAGVPLNYLAQFSPALREHMRGDLTLGADWALDLRTAAATGGAPALDGSFHVFRERGDLIVGEFAPVALGLRTLDARADVAAGALRMRLDLDGARAGQAKVDATAQMIQGMLSQDSPLRFSANADIGTIAWLAPLAGQPGLELDGALKLAINGGGTIGVPSLNGSVSGDRLAVRWPDQGVSLRNGELRAQLAGDQLVLQRMVFEGRQGRATADGNVRFAAGEATMQLKLVADKLEVLSRPDRTVVVSGEGTLVRDAKRFELDGKFRAERALIELAPQGRPTMSDDVIVLGRAGADAKAAKPEASMPLNVDLALELGDDFHLRGMGVDAYLKGNVRLRKPGSRPPRVNGTIRVAEGNYAAYGQKLAIERGVVTFSGAYDNPSLDILAVRKRPEGEPISDTNVEAGVAVRGTALSPDAKLVSTPSVPDSEKLAWLVLGHGLDNTSGNEADVLGAAAAALLGGKGGGGGIAQKLGLDEIGFAQGKGAAKGLESTVVTIGKRISSRAYLSLEQGTSTATSMVRLRYKLNPRFTLQFQTGTNTALDVLYSWAFD